MKHPIISQDMAIVVAHPDDEVLWFASMLREASRIVMCYGDNTKLPKRGDQRRAVVAQYPLAGVVFLDIPEPISDRPTSPEHTAHHPSELCDRLRHQLRGVRTILTHNPWGEYGHRHHRFVHDIVQRVAAQIGADVFVSCYVGVASMSLAGEVLRRGIAHALSAEIDHVFAREIQGLYAKSGCWTWQRNWKWPKRENFYRLGSANADYDQSHSLRLILPPWQMDK